MNAFRHFAHYPNDEYRMLPSSIIAQQAAAIRKAIESYFGENVAGDDTDLDFEGRTLLRSFDPTPHLPANWNSVSLRSIRAFGSDYSIRIDRDGKNTRIVKKEATKGWVKANSVVK